METKRIGAQTLRFSRPPRVESFANIGAKLDRARWRTILTS